MILSLVALVFAVGGPLVAVFVAHLLDERRAQEQGVTSAKNSLRALRGEVTENVQLASRPIIGDGKVNLRREQYEAARPYLSELPGALAQQIGEAYVEVQRYNSSVETERVKIARGLGYMDKEIQQLAASAKDKLENALALGGWPD